MNGPFIKDSDSYDKIILRILISIMPIIAYSIFKYSVVAFFNSDIAFIQTLRPVFIILISLFTSIVTEILYKIIVSRSKIKESLKISKYIYSILNSIIISLILPINIPLYIVFLSSFICTIINKIFKSNIYSPYLAYLIIYILFNNILSDNYIIYTASNVYNQVVNNNLLSFVVGNSSIILGTSSILVMLFSFLYLCITNTIKYEISLSYIFSIIIMYILLSSLNNNIYDYNYMSLICNSILFTSIFAVNDIKTSVITNDGKILYGTLLGIVTIILCSLNLSSINVFASVLIINLFSNIIDNYAIKMKYSNSTKVSAYIILSTLILIIPIFISKFIL